MAEIIRFPGDQEHRGNATRDQRSAASLDALSAAEGHQEGSLVSLADYDRRGDGCLGPAGTAASDLVLADGLNALTASFIGSAADAFAAGQSAEHFRERTLALPNSAGLLFEIARDLLAFVDQQKTRFEANRWPWGA